VDDTSLLITNSDSQMFENDINTVLAKLSSWFHSNLLLLNLEKTYFLQFVTKNTTTMDLQMLCENKQILSVNTAKF
jgi:hypothetical protein